MAEKSKAAKPLIHCITNPISMNQSANTVLAIGARPIMAEHPLEVEEITETADALLLNFGNISDTRMEAMEKALPVANKNNIPVVIDVVGSACSKLRLQFFSKLMDNHQATVIKGNYSEILALYDHHYRAAGVDAEKGVQKATVEFACKQLAKQYKALILATGEEDLIADEEKVFFVKGGCKELGSVTGTGCMLGAIVATFLTTNKSMENVEKACKFFKECGRKAVTDKGPGTFMVNLMDRLGECNEI